jgi:hypothetical protein
VPGLDGLKEILEGIFSLARQFNNYVVIHKDFIYLRQHFKTHSVTRGILKSQNFSGIIVIVCPRSQWGKGWGSWRSAQW